MARRLGSKGALRAAATYAANNTWYAVTNTFVMPGTGNALIVECTPAVGSCGQIDFYATVLDDGTNAFQYDSGLESPEVLGSVTTSGAGQLRTTVLPIPFPGSTVQLYFRCSAGAGASTLAISGTPAEDNTTIVSVGDIEVDAAALEVLVTATNALLTTIDADTGNVATKTTDIPNVIGIDGSAGPTKTLSIAGTHAGGNIQEMAVDTVGQVRGAGGWLKVHGSDILVDFSAAVATSAVLTAGKTYDLCSTEDCYVCATTAAADDATSSDTPIPAWTKVRVTVPTDEATNLYISAIKNAVGGVLHISEVDD